VYEAAFLGIRTGVVGVTGEACEVTGEEAMVLCFDLAWG